MQCCPENILDLGCFSSCENVPLDGLNVDGKLVTYFNGHLYVETDEFIDEIPTSSLNENYTYVVQFYNSDGTVYTLNGFDGFRFTLLPLV